jgi:uncharacterized damage-inducible protein DinB
MIAGWSCQAIFLPFRKQHNRSKEETAAMRVPLKVLSMVPWVALATGPVLLAQAPGAPLPAEATANPVVWSAKMLYQRDAKNIVAAAEQMPADKYSYHPTADQWTFGKLVSHVAQSNGGLCGALSGMPAPAALHVSDTASKEELVAALKASFDFCGTALDGLTDAKLGEPVTMFHRTMPRATALVALPSDLADHYSQMAAYLRLNGMLPPSAQRSSH